MGSAVGTDDLIDGLHPNTKGHIKIYNLMKSELKVSL